jgi:uncharacterized protein
VSERSIEDRYVTDEVSKPFWSALAAGHLVLPTCGRCGSVFFHPRRFCPQCWSDDIGWVESTGTGTVFARSEVHAAFQDIDPSELPITVVLVDLDEGVRLPGRLRDADAQIGDRVQLRFADEPMFELPRFVRTQS